MSVRDISGFLHATVLGDLRSADKLNAEIEEELLFHIQERKERLIASGLTEAEAESEARRLFGDFFETRQQCIKSYHLGANLALKRFAIVAGLIVITIASTLYVAERLRPVTSIEDRLSTLFADLNSSTVSRRQAAIVDALELADNSELSSLRQEIYSRVSSVPLPEVVRHLESVALDPELAIGLRLSAVESLGSIAVDDPATQGFLLASARLQTDSVIVGAMLDQVVDRLDNSALQSLVCGDKVSRPAKLWALIELKSRCGKDFDANMTWMADPEVLSAAKSLVLTTVDNEQQISIVKLFRECSCDPVRDWLLDLIDQPVQHGCLVHVLFDLGQYVNDELVAERLRMLAQDANLAIQNHIKRSLALRTE